MKDLLAKYGKLTDLRPDERDVFTSLALARRSYDAGTELVTSEIDEPDQLYIVEQGRLFASIDLSCGVRAITRLYFSGDIVGTANVPFDHATQTITVNAPSVLYVFPRRKLVDAFITMPRVAAIFYTFAAMEGAILNDRLVSVGRTRGRARLASLILEIEARRNLLSDPALDKFSLGLTQAQIGETIGLTEVQVSRLFRQFLEEGLIEKSDGATRIVDKQRLIEMGQFTDRYADLNLDWFDE